MSYFFGNERNEKGLCATLHCTRKPVQTFVYEYCNECFNAIVSSLEAGHIPDTEQMVIPEGGSGMAGLQDQSMPPTAA